MNKLLALGSAALLACHASLALAQESPSNAGPRNVILIVGDGMDEQQITIARNYLHGASGELLLDQMPLRGAAQILTTENNASGRPVYVADSANTATSMATGVVTSRGRLATTAGTDEDIPTIVELATAAGFRAGIVSSASVTDATPASFAAHISFRLCENPGLMQAVVVSDIHLGDCIPDTRAQGGPGSIAEQLAESSLHVLLGGGAKHFAPIAEGDTRSVQQVASDNGFTVLESKQDLANAPADARLLGTFAPSTLPVRMQGEDGRTAEQPRRSFLNYIHRYLGSVTLPSPMRCEPNPGFAEIPSLQAMTDVALRNLSHNNDRGFFLMVESASIDKQAHERKPCGSIGELQQLDEVLQSALAFAEQQPNTLIIVTADHSQAAQIVPDTSLFAAYPIPVFTPGYLARIVTPEGAHMAVNYATTTFFMEEHTGAAVPLYGNAQAVGHMPPYLRQPELFGVARDYLGF
ncbi:MAG: alkaline phosphatase [Halioglobus sp.]|nr:alkaline phosphatase [Halioglobus sp.]